MSRGYAFQSDDGRWFLVRCFDCGLENWAPAVATGKCAWCGSENNGQPRPVAAPPDTGGA